MILYIPLIFWGLIGIGTLITFIVFIIEWVKEKDDE